MAAPPAGTATTGEQIAAYMRYPFASCLPTASSRRGVAQDEREGLLADASYDDSDAISLLSNIANRSRRRGSRSSRRREEWRKRAATTLGCGLFGRPKGQIQPRQVTVGDGIRAQHARQHSGGSSTGSSDGGRGFGSEDEAGGTGSFGAGQESGDEDAGMLGDDDIAEMSRDGDGDDSQQEVPTVHVSAVDEEHTAAETQEAQQRAAVKAQLEREAAEYARAEEEDAVRRAAEEDALAAEEEAAAAKARRRAERRAVKEGLSQVRAESQRPRRWTEAEAEAAAGGFDFAEEEQEQEQEQREQGEWEEEGQETQYGLASGPEGYGYHGQAEPQQEVVHHHHYYHEPPAEDEYDDRLLSPHFTLQSLPGVEPAGEETQSTAVEEDEDDADIAGLTFSKSKKGRTRGEGGSQSYSAGRSNGSGGSGSRQSGSASGQGRHDMHRKGSDQSGDGGANAKRSYRDRPRRHERTGSRSTGSGSGARLREGVPARNMVTSPTIDERAAADDRADAAAGGFDDVAAPPRHSTADTASTGSSGQRRERRREGPRQAPRQAGGLNSPRNPHGTNVFVQSREGADIF